MYRTREEEIIERDLFFTSIEAIPSERTRKISEIYWIYLKWAALNNREPMTKMRFGTDLKDKYKAVFNEHGHETRYHVDCPLLNLKYEDKVALKEYRKEEAEWRRKEAKRKVTLKKLRRTRREKRQLKKENEQNTPDSKSDSSPE